MADGNRIDVVAGAPQTRAEAEALAWSLPLEQIDAADPYRFGLGAELALFERLRRDAPVHYQAEHKFGPYWSVTRYEDIMAVDTNHEAFSSEPAITVADPEEDLPLPMFIAMDPPKHDAQRKTVSPIVAGPNLQALEPLIASAPARSWTPCRWASGSTGWTRCRWS